MQPSSLTPFFELGGQLLADRTVENTLGLRLILVQERQVVDLERRLDLGHHRIGDDAGVHRAEAHAFEHRLLVAELAIGEKLHLDAATRTRLDAFLERPRADRVGILRAVGRGPAELDDGLGLRAHVGREPDAGAERQAQRKCAARDLLDHAISSHSCCSDQASLKTVEAGGIVDQHSSALRLVRHPQRQEIEQIARVEHRPVDGDDAASPSPTRNGPARPQAGPARRPPCRGRAYPCWRSDRRPRASPRRGRPGADAASTGTPGAPCRRSPAYAPCDRSRPRWAAARSRGRSQARRGHRAAAGCANRAVRCGPQAVPSSRAPRRRRRAH